MAKKRKRKQLVWCYLNIKECLCLIEPYKDSISSIVVRIDVLQVLSNKLFFPSWKFPP